MHCDNHAHTHTQPHTRTRTGLNWVLRPNEKKKAKKEDSKNQALGPAWLEWVEAFSVCLETKA